MNNNEKQLLEAVHLAIPQWLLAVCIIVVVLTLSMNFYKEHIKNDKNASDFEKGLGGYIISLYIAFPFLLLYSCDNITRINLEQEKWKEERRYEISKPPVIASDVKLPEITAASEPTSSEVGKLNLK